jgi:hypothetical protein
MQLRYEEALRVTSEMTRKGLLVYSPIVHFHLMAEKYNMPADFNFWQKNNFGMLDHADSIAVLTIDGWKESKGVKSEVQHAVMSGKDFYYIHPNLSVPSRTLIEIELEAEQ